MADGRLMVEAAICGLKKPEGSSVTIAILKEHEDKYSIMKGLRKALGHDIEICVLDVPTRSQSETVARVIEKLKLSGQIFIKDSDNTFSVDLPNHGNFVCHDTLNNHELINPSNKSYAILNQNKIITRLAEKRVISDIFSVGGYGFADAAHFLESYENLSTVQHCEGELYISDVISFMMARGDIFSGLPVSNYQDWGTMTDWHRSKARYKTYFVDIDGVVFENGAEFFSPHWGETEPISKNVKVLLELEKHGNQIIFTTSRKEEFRDATRRDLLMLGFSNPYIVMNLLSSQRVLINDFSPSNPFPSARAINISRDSDELGRFI